MGSHKMSFERVTHGRKAAGSGNRKEEGDNEEMKESIYTEPVDVIQDNFYSVPFSKDDQATNKQAENIKGDVDIILSSAKSFQVLENLPKEFVLIVEDFEESQRNDCLPCFLVPKQRIKHLSGNIHMNGHSEVERKGSENAQKDTVEIRRALVSFLSEGSRKNRRAGSER